jgi:hypothetical protein
MNNELRISILFSVSKYRKITRICFIYITFHIELSRLETPATLYRRDDITGKSYLSVL